MSIPTQRATRAKPNMKQVGRDSAEQRGFETREMPKPEHARRWDRLASDIIPNSRIPDGARK